MEKALKNYLPSGEFRQVPVQRSKMMSSIRGQANRSTEWRFHGALINARIRGWTLHPNGILGRPDFYFSASRLMTYGVISEFNDGDLERIVGVVAVVTGLGAVGVPILNRMHGIDKKERAETAGREMTIVCPRCLKQQVVPAGASRCSGCRLKFTIEIEEPRCPKCDYLLYRLESARCPECGELLGEGEVEAARGVA